MKKLFFVLTGFWFLSTNAQTAEEIIQKYATNLGGLAAFNAIKTMKTTGTMSTNGIDLAMTVQAINNKAARTELEFNGMRIINVYNAGKGWKQNPIAGITEPVAVTDIAELNEMKPASILATPLMDYKARGHKVELLGEETVEGIKTWKIKLIAKENSKVTLYYITPDYILLKSESERDIQGEKISVETWYSDLKDFNGIKFFMTRIQKMADQVFQSITLANIELNTIIDEKIFDMPK